MAVTICHASISEHGDAGWNGKAKAGDQTGKEVCTRAWYAKGWTVMLHYPDAEIRKKAASIAKKLAKSNLVGYDQSQRNTLYQKLKKHNFDVDAYIASGEKSETDCSAFMYACYACLLPGIRSDSNAPATSTMRNAFKKYGFVAYTSTRYLSTDANLEIGDVIVREGHHTAMAVTNGKNVTVTTSEKKVYAGEFPKLPARGFFRNGDVSEQVKLLKKFLNWYGSYGLTPTNPNYLDYTEECVKRFQRAENLTADGKFGPKSLAAAKKVKR